MRHGGEWSPCCRRWTDAAVRGVITGRWSTGCCGGCGPGLLGATCPSGTGRGRPSTSGSPAGRLMAPGRSCWSTSRSVTTRWAGWSGPSLSTPRETGPTSTPRAPVKGGHGRGRTGRSGPLADAPGPRPVPGRADHQGPPRRRRPGSAAVDRAHTRKRQRRHCVRRGPRQDPHPARWHGPPAHDTGPRAG